MIIVFALVVTTTATVFAIVVTATKTAGGATTNGNVVVVVASVRSEGEELENRVVAELKFTFISQTNFLFHQFHIFL